MNKNNNSMSQSTRGVRWCKHCCDYRPKNSYVQHMAQHNIGNPAIDHTQFRGVFDQKTENYFICVLHQKKTPCKARKYDGSKCDYPFGIISKKFMLDCIRGKPLVPSTETDPNFRYPPFFPVSDERTKAWSMIPIDVESRTVIINKATIHLKF